MKLDWYTWEQTATPQIEVKIKHFQKIFDIKMKFKESCIQTISTAWFVDIENSQQLDL